MFKLFDKGTWRKRLSVRQGFVRRATIAVMRNSICGDGALSPYHGNGLDSANADDVQLLSKVNAVH